MGICGSASKNKVTNDPKPADKDTKKSGAENGNNPQTDSQQQSVKNEPQPTKMNNTQSKDSKAFEKLVSPKNEPIMHHNQQSETHQKNSEGPGLDKTQDNIKITDDSPMKASTNTINEFTHGYLEQMYAEGIEEELGEKPE